MTVDSELDARAEVRIGTVLRGKYRLDRVLGVGGMATVYAATHRNKKRFAVKVLHPELSLRSDIRMRFVREGYAANSVEHEGTVAVLDDDVAEDGAAFLVMELLDGETVESAWERTGRRMPPQATLSIGYQLLDVLVSAHRQGIVHRDIKPANLFLTRDGRLKVLDFGIARVRDAATSHATQTGAMMGTPAFMAPEQALGRTAQVDGQTDVWAVGATMFTLASGRLVYEADTAQAMMVQAATQPPPLLATVLPGVPRALAVVVDRALAYQKTERWPGAAETRDAVRDASASLLGGRQSAPSLPKVVAGMERTLLSEQDDPPEPATHLMDVRAARDGGRPAPTTTEPALTTAEPVSSDSAPRRHGAGSLIGRRVAMGGTAAGVLAITLGILIATRRAGTGTATATALPRPSNTAEPSAAMPERSAAAIAAPPP